MAQVVLQLMTAHPLKSLSVGRKPFKNLILKTLPFLKIFHLKILYLLLVVEEAVEVGAGVEAGVRPKPKPSPKSKAKAKVDGLDEGKEAVVGEVQQLSVATALPKFLVRRSQRAAVVVVAETSLLLQSVHSTIAKYI
jgi:hypothetical protein